MPKSNVTRFALIGLLLAVCISFSAISRSFAQAPQTVPGQNPPQPGVRVGPTEDTVSPNYREPKGGKDPFYDEKLFPPKPKLDEGGKPKPIPVEEVKPPSFEDRDAAWKQKREQARKDNRPEPSPSEKYLVDEVKILGTYKKPDGQGVFLKPTATTSTVLFANVGQEFWNGKIVRIEKDKVEFEVRTKYTDGKTKTETQFRPFTRK
jgi:hypothetical protein